MLKGIAMSRPPLRQLFRLVHSGLEKAALACAAFGLLHASAKADARDPAEVSLADPWSNPAAQPAHIDDAWGTLASRGSTPDDGWTARIANRADPSEQPVAIAPVTAPVATPSTLVNDRSDWNDIPRARSPGLIAANDAWRNRVVDGNEWNAAPLKATEPAPVEAPGKSSSADPWLSSDPAVAAVPAAGADTQWGAAVKPFLRGTVDNSAHSRTQAATPIQSDARKADWSRFAGSARLNGQQGDAWVVDRISSEMQDPAKTRLHVAMNDFVALRSRVAMTPGGRWHPPVPGFRGSGAASALQ
jgi:hypothetical protein